MAASLFPLLTVSVSRELWSVQRCASFQLCKEILELNWSEVTSDVVLDGQFMLSRAHRCIADLARPRKGSTTATSTDQIRLSRRPMSAVRPRPGCMLLIPNYDAVQCECATLKSVYLLAPGRCLSPLPVYSVGLSLRNYRRP